MRLGVNIDHVATVRQARRAREPEPITAALLAEMAGAEGITVHLRGDRRHIQERDIELLREAIATKLNVEMAATAEMVRIASRVKPDQVTLVPERPDELTTTGGLDVAGAARAQVSRAAGRLTKVGIAVSVFIDADPAQVRASRSTAAGAIEINTGPYADARTGHARKAALARVADAARLARDEGLEVLAGHGLTYVNVHPIALIQEIAEVNIGHSLIARAVLVGMDRAVREMIALLNPR